MADDQGKSKRKPRRKPQGMQWSLDQEMADKAPRGTENVDNFTDSALGEGRGGDIPNNINIIDLPSPPPSHPSPKTCLYEHPGTREQIRHKLQELEVTNINQLIRTYPAADLIEAISDFERALDEGMRIKSPTGYFRSLLK